MTSKKSFWVNIRTNARRRVWLFVIMFLAFFFTGPVFLSMALSMEKMYYTLGNLRMHLGTIFAVHVGLDGGTGFLVSVLAVFSAIQGFSYMYQRKKLDLYMSVPVTKERRFAAIYINGLLAYLLAYLFNLLLSFFVAQAMGADISQGFAEAGAALLGYTLLYLAVYHIAILAVMLTGNLIVTLMGVLVLLFYDGCIYLLLGGYTETFFSSFHYRSMEKWSKFMISPVVRFFTLIDSTFDFGVNYDYYRRSVHWGNFGMGVAPIAVVAVIAGILAYWCYTKKPSEVCGKSMAFPKTKPVIKVFVTSATGLAAGVICYQLSGQSLAFFGFGMLAGTLLCHSVVEVIYDFDIRSVKNGWKSLLVCGGVVLAVFCVFLFDLTGYDSYVPDPDRVDHVAIRFADDYNTYYDEELNTVNSETYVFDHMAITDIAPVLELAHRRMGEVPELGSGTRYCVVQYTLKGGKKVYREFPVAYREDTALLDEIFTDSAYQKGCSVVYNDPVMQLKESLRLYYDDGRGRNEVTDISLEQLKNAYQKDLEGFTFTETMESLAQGKFEIECIERGMYVHTSMPVYPSFANTIALLEKAGMYREGYVDIGNVEQIIVRNSNTDIYDSYMEEGEYALPYIDFETEATFDNPGEIQQIADSLYPDSFMDYWMPDGTLDNNYSVTVICRREPGSEEGYSCTYYMLSDRIPDFVKERTAYTPD